MKIKIFYKKDYEYMKEQNTKLNGKNRELESEIKKAYNAIEDLTLVEMDYTK